MFIYCAIFLYIITIPNKHITNAGMHARKDEVLWAQLFFGFLLVADESSEWEEKVAWKGRSAT